MTTAIEVTRGLLAQIGLPEEAAGAMPRIVGEDPLVPSIYRVGTAAAAALAAEAAGVDAIWRMRGGGAQEVTVDMRRACVPGLRTGLFARRDGLQLFLRRPPAERKVFFRSRDNRLLYVLRSSLYNDHFRELLKLLGCSPRDEDIAAAVAGWDAEALEETLAEHRLIGAIVRTREEWLAHPQGRWLAERPAVEVEKIGDSAPEPFAPGARPLSGVRVADMGHILAGPVIARVLAEQGADILHLSSPQQFEAPHIVVDTGFGKRSALVDLNAPGGTARLMALIADGDVFLHSWRPGSLEKHGLSPEELARLRPGIIYCSVSCYGYGGPWKTRAGYDPLGQIVSGLATGEGSLVEPKLASTGTLNDYLCAYLGAAGVLAALIRRAREGGSYHVKVSLTRASMWVQELGLLPPAQWPSGADGVRDMPDPRPGELMLSPTPFGEIEHAAPVVQFSETKARWELPPEPAGASPMVWLDR